MTGGGTGAASEPERLARVVLSRVAEPGEARMTSLVADVGAAAVLGRLHAEGEGGGLAADLAVRLAGCDPAGELERAGRLGLRFVVPGDAEWPPGLEDLARAEALQQRGGVPVGLWVRGPWTLDGLDDRRCGAAAVVGSRSATSYGADVACQIAADLAHHGHPVVSGAAFGIDQSAHRGALAAGRPTVAVLACGADRVYPRAHQSLLEHILGDGAVVSETPPGGAPTRVRFLARNRLIAALTRATVVVEAAVRSGALNTAGWAERLHRHVAGVPGPVTSAASQGVHQLVRRGSATLVTSGEEVRELVSPAGQGLLSEARGPEVPRDRLSTRQQVVLDAVPVARPAPADAIARAAGVRVVEVAGELERLRAAGLVERVGPRWRLARPARVHG